MKITALDEAALTTARAIHVSWRLALRADSSTVSRWKTLSSSDAAWARANRQALGKLLRISPVGMIEINIAAAPFDALPPSYRKENLVSARAAIKSLLEHPRRGEEFHAETAHKDWLARNSRRAPEHQLRPYAALTPREKEKDRSVVRIAAAVLGLRLRQRAQNTKRPSRPRH